MPNATMAVGSRLQHSPSLRWPPSPPPHLCSPSLPGMCSSRSRGYRQRQLRVRRIRRGRDGPLGSGWAPGLTNLVLNINVIAKVELVFSLSLAIHSVFYSLPRFFLSSSLKLSSLACSPCCSSRPFLSTFNALFFVVGIATY